MYQVLVKVPFNSTRLFLPACLTLGMSRPILEPTNRIDSDGDIPVIAEVAHKAVAESIMN